MARPSNLSKLSINDLQSELLRRQRAAGSLVQKRDALLQKLSALEADIAAAGIATSDGPRKRGRPPGSDAASASAAPAKSGGRKGRRRRAVNDETLPQALAKVIAGKTMSVTEAAEAVKASGYKTYSSNFRVQVNIALTKNPKLFKRVERGMYTTK